MDRELFPYLDGLRKRLFEHGWITDMVETEDSIRFTWTPRGMKRLQALDALLIDLGDETTPDGRQTMPVGEIAMLRSLAVYDAR